MPRRGAGLRDLAVPTCAAWGQKKDRASCWLLSSTAELGRTLSPTARFPSILNVQASEASSLTSPWRGNQADFSVSTPV